MRVWNCVQDSLDDSTREDVIARDQVAELVWVVATARPLQFRIVNVVADPVVREWTQPMLVDGIPKSKFRRDAVAEPMKDWLVVASFGRGGQPKQFARLK